MSPGFCVVLCLCLLDWECKGRDQALHFKLTIFINYQHPASVLLRLIINAVRAADNTLPLGLLGISHLYYFGMVDSIIPI